MLMDDVDERPAEAAPLTAAEKRDARRAARQLKKLEAEDKAKLAAQEGEEYPGLDKYIHDNAVIRPAATNKQLVSFIERVEQIELEMAGRAEDRKQIYAEARSCGFDVPTLKKVVALRKMDANDRRAADELLTMMATCPTCGQQVAGDRILIGISGELARGGRAIKLRSGHAVKLIRTLYRAFPNVVTYDALVAELYGHRSDGGADYAIEIVRSRVCILRAAIRPLALSIHAEWGIGYRLVINPMPQLEKAA